MKDLKHVQNLDQGEKGEFSEHEGNPGSKDIVNYYRIIVIILFSCYRLSSLSCTRMFVNTYGNLRHPLSLENRTNFDCELLGS